MNPQFYKQAVGPAGYEDPMKQYLYLLIGALVGDRWFEAGSFVVCEERRSAYFQAKGHGLVVGDAGKHADALGKLKETKTFDTCTEQERVHVGNLVMFFNAIGNCPDESPEWAALRASIADPVGDDDWSIPFERLYHGQPEPEPNLTVQSVEEEKPKRKRKPKAK